MSCLAFRSFTRSWLAAIVLLLPVTVKAQQPAAADTLFLHAHRLVSQGQGDLGRALIDSLLTTATPGTPAYAEGLFWRAVTAARSADAERDYLRIVIEYPLSPRAEDALIRLAELEMMRGDRMRAQRHLQRLIIEHPNGASRARASYWLARVYFDGNDLPRACNELNVAKSRAAPADVELRNQVDYQAQRCVGVAVVMPAPQAPAPASTIGTTPAPAPATVASSSSAAPPTTPPSTVTTPPVVAPPSTVTQPPPTSAPVVPPPAPPASAVSAPVTAAPRPAATTGSRPAPAFSVQVAAFPTQAAADKFRESLAAMGYDVRIWGTEAPFRVRVGRFATRADANAMAQELRAKMISKDAWVVEAEVR
jgi:cell division septation protein DedD